MVIKIRRAQVVGIRHNFERIRWYVTLSALAIIAANSLEAIHIELLLSPALSALKSLLYLRIDPSPYWMITSQNALSEDARKVQRACRSLKKLRDFHKVTIDGALLSATAKRLVKSLSRSTIEKLSVIAWHFDASGGQGANLRDFLRYPRKNTLWEAIHKSYQTMTKQKISFREFKASHDFLLSPPVL